MKAMVLSGYGQLELREVEKPVPRDNEVLVEVHATSVTTHNLVSVAGRPFFVRLMGAGLLRPKMKVPGSDVAGTVAAAGRNAKLFQPGDEVFGDLSQCGFGALAEYVSVPENALTRKPANLLFEEAAAVPQAALVALQGLRDKGRIQSGHSVLIYGASGGIGTFAVQLAKHFGAEVTGVCSTRNLDLVRSLGADCVIDYTEDDFTGAGRRYDLVLAIAYRPIFDFVRALKPRGIYVSTGGPSLARVFQDMALGPWMARHGNYEVVGGWSVVPNKGLSLMKELIEAGKVIPVIDRCYPMVEAPDAFRYYAQGHSRGRVVISVSGRTGKPLP